MSSNFVDYRAQDVQDIINEDAWDMTVYRRPQGYGAEETSFTFVGTVHAEGTRGVPLVISTNMAGESPVARYAWVILGPKGTPALKQHDEIRAVQRANSSVERVFIVAYGAQYAYKQEAIAEERQ